MSNRMKTGIFVSIAIFLLGILLMRFAILQSSSFIQEDVTDEALIKELREIATTSLKDYFDIEIDETRPWETKVVLNKSKEEDAAEPVYSVMQKDSTEDLEEGQIISYGVMMREDTKEVVGMIYMPATNSENKEITDEEIGDRTVQFLQDKKIAKENEELKVVHTERDDKSGLVKVMIEGQGMGYSMVYNLKTDSVNYFEKGEIPSQTE